MSEDHKCGPDQDTDFFRAINEVFNRFPAAAAKYAIGCMDHETQIMGIDFSKTELILRIVGNQIITDQQDRSQPGPAPAADLICCEWQRVADNTWRCTSRWDRVQ
jgi:hypothetical protein